MEEDILGKVVEAENEIRKRVETEKAKAAEWLAGAEDDARKELDRTREELNGTLEAAIEEARSDSEEKTARLIRDAESSAQKLEGLESGKLRKIILRHISVILPGD